MSRIYNKICPVCGYDGFVRIPKVYDMCPCCLFEFGVNDTDWTYDELRADWIAHGAQWAWGGKEIPRPYLWSPILQLHNVKYKLTGEDLQNIARANRELSL